MQEKSINKKHKIMRIVLCIIFALLAFILTVLIVYTVRAYNPADVEDIQTSDGQKVISVGDSMTLVTYNTGYSGLGAAEDFFMDGGKEVRPESKELVEGYLEGNAELLKENDADIYLLQEVDLDSDRSYNTDQQAYYESALGMDSMYSCNYRCFFIPYPLPMLGKVESGILTMTDLKVTEAQRIALPVSFPWPISTCNLKRGLLVSRIPVENSDKELVVINLHLEAYDDGEGKVAQAKALKTLMRDEYKKGNYVIVGGDFNQTFDGVTEYPVKDESYWTPGKFDLGKLSKHFSLAVADNDSTTRLDNAPYDAETTQEYIIDGFIISDNLKLESVEVVDTEYEYSDHRPVKMKVTIKE